jgi:hypothetical protein
MREKNTRWYAQHEQDRRDGNARPRSGPNHERNRHQRHNQEHDLRRPHRVVVLRENGEKLFNGEGQIHPRPTSYNARSM